MNTPHPLQTPPPTPPPPTHGPLLPHAPPPHPSPPLLPAPPSLSSPLPPPRPPPPAISTCTLCVCESSFDVNSTQRGPSGDPCMRAAPRAAARACRRDRGRVFSCRPPRCSHTRTHKPWGARGARTGASARAQGPATAGPRCVCVEGGGGKGLPGRPQPASKAGHAPRGLRPRHHPPPPAPPPASAPAAPTPRVKSASPAPRGGAREWKNGGGEGGGAGVPGAHRRRDRPATCAGGSFMSNTPSFPPPLPRGRCGEGCDCPIACQCCAGTSKVGAAEAAAKQA